MAITKVQQLQISGTLAARISDSVTNANLAKANRTLEDDLNSLRTQIKLIMGTNSWTDSLSGSLDLADIHGALHVTGSTAAFQGNVYTAGGSYVSGTLVVAGTSTLQGVTATTISGSGALQVGGNITTAGNLVADQNTPRVIFTDVTDITIGGAASTINVAGDLKVTGNDIKSSTGATAITLSGADVSIAGNLTGSNVLANGTLTTTGDAFIGGNIVADAEEAKSIFVNVGANNITIGGASSTVIIGNDLQVNGNDIKSSTGQTAIQLTGESIVIPGDLTVNGTTTTINTNNLEIKDAVVGLGFASGTIQQSAGDRGWIGGLAGGDNVAFFWDNSATEFVVSTTTNSATGSLPIPIGSYSNFHAAQISGSIVKAQYGLSGSLTRLVDGTSYIVAGSGITVVSSSNGQVTISNNAMSQVTKGYLAGTSTHISASNGIVTFGPAGANIGTLSSADDEKLDVFLNGIFMAFGYDISTITQTTFTLDQTIVNSLTADDIISIVLRGTM